MSDGSGNWQQRMTRLTMKINRHAARGKVLDDEAVAYHEAAHAVAMWRSGFGVVEVSIEGREGLRGYAEPARKVAIRRENPPWANSALVELASTYLLAGDVATRLLRPDVGSAQSQTDHQQLHDLMFAMEDDGA